MNKYLAIIFLLLVSGCSKEQTEEFVFRKVIQRDLVERCGEDNPQCVEAVEQQIESCMEKSDWRRVLENEDDEEEMKRFVFEFYPCFKDPDGNSYFG